MVKVNDLVKLIRESAKQGVLELQFGDFSIKFREAKDLGQNLMPELPGQVPGLPDNNESQINLFDESEILEMEKSQQLVDDPVGFEMDQIRDQIENRRTSGEIDEEAQA